jgi:hypothetical protein
MAQSTFSSFGRVKGEKSQMEQIMDMQKDEELV